MYLAACGETLNIEFTLPFTEFVPATCHTRFSLRVSPSAASGSALIRPALNTGRHHGAAACLPQAEDTDMRLSLPECHPSRYPLLTVAKDYQSVKLPGDGVASGDGHGAPSSKTSKPRWRNVTIAE